ncbi:hypothetical protein ACQ5SK_26730 [Bradyrhizobium japonicum]
MADQQLLAIVWGETSGLAAKDGSNQTLARLHAVVAKLAAAAQRRGLGGNLKQQLAPRANDAVAMVTYNAMSSTVSAVETNTYRAEMELPARAVLWEVNENGAPPRDNLPPTSVAWMFDADVTSGGDFVAGTGADTRTYRLFELPNFLPRTSCPTSPVIPIPVSFGLRTGDAGIEAQLGDRTFRRRAFFLAAFSLLWTASSFSLAYDLLANWQIEDGQKFSSSLPLPACPAGGGPDQKACETAADTLKGKSGTALDDARKSCDKKLYDLFSDQGPTCVERLTKWADETKPPVDPKTKKPISADDQAKNLFCLALLGDAVKFAAQNLVIKADTWVGHAAQFVGWWLFGWHVPTSGAQAVSLGMPTALMMLGVILVLVGLGKGVNGTPLGALISPNGRYSLALAQVTSWTVLVLTSVMAIAIFNGGLVSEMVR